MAGRCPAQPRASLDLSDDRQCVRAVGRGDLDPDDRAVDGDRPDRRARRRSAPRNGDVTRRGEWNVTRTIRRRAFLGSAAALAMPLVLGRRAAAGERSITAGIYT